MLQLLGKCSGADRVYIFDIKEKNRNEYFCLQYEWKNDDDILEIEQLFSEITVEDILILPLNRNLNHIRKFLVVIKILKYGSVIYLDVMIVADLFILIHV